MRPVLGDLLAAASDHLERAAPEDGELSVEAAHAVVCQLARAPR